MEKTTRTNHSSGGFSISFCVNNKVLLATVRLSEPSFHLYNQRQRNTVTVWEGD